MPSISKQPCVVIVGGGPIGLAHAWSIKKLNPDIRVVVLEKYQEYQRKHTLVMQHKQLAKLIKATNTHNDPILNQLMRDLKADPNIRTNDLEGRFKQLALESKVEIINEEVKKETIKEQISKFQPNLIIGADGTHSVVSDALFPAGNQIKYEFDYVLQLRYEIEGENRPGKVSQTSFLQQMLREGIIASEYVGQPKDGKTPVTMQMMISKKVFDQLKKDVTSKKPVFLNGESQENQSELEWGDLPDDVRRFLNNYLINRIFKNVDTKSIRVSVNEAPATHAKQVVNHTEDGIPVLLVGDAGLGLSYFKGLNAGLESSANLIARLASAIRNGLNDISVINKACKCYEEWFLEDFAPKKVKEVASYSLWNIRSVMAVAKVTRYFKGASEIEDDANDIVEDYYRYLAPEFKNEINKDDDNEANLYPHRKQLGRKLAKLGQWKHIPIDYTLHKTAKIFIDFFKPYKSEYYVKRDYKIPLIGVVNIMSGTAKVIAGLLTLNALRFLDGMFSLVRGLIEVAITPLSWLVKPVTRLIASLIHGPKYIEDNASMKQIAQMGMDALQKIDEATLENDNHTKYTLLAFCDDLNRKVVKSNNRAQYSPQYVDLIGQYQEIRASSKDSLNKEKMANYFSLFGARKQLSSDKSDDEMQPPLLDNSGQNDFHS